MRISDWSSDVCSSDLAPAGSTRLRSGLASSSEKRSTTRASKAPSTSSPPSTRSLPRTTRTPHLLSGANEKYGALSRSEEHTSELQSLMRISYAVFCLKNNNHYLKTTNTHT